MSVFHRADAKPAAATEVRLSRGASMLMIGVLSAVAWAIVLALIWAFSAAL